MRKRKLTSSQKNKQKLARLRHCESASSAQKPERERNICESASMTHHLLFLQFQTTSRLNWKKENSFQGNWNPNQHDACLKILFAMFCCG